MELINNLELNWVADIGAFPLGKFNRVRGYIAKQPIFVIINVIGKEDWTLNNYASINCELFKGSLEECKNYANTLLYGTTREV